MAALTAVSLSLASPVALAQAPAESADEGAEPSPYDKELAAAQEAAEAGKWEEALAAYERAREIDPGADLNKAIAEAHFRVGETKYAKAEYQEALENFQDAQSFFPSPQFHYNIAQCYEELDKPEQAIESYKAYLRGIPDAGDRPRVESKIEDLEEEIERRKQLEAAQNKPTEPTTPTTPQKEPPLKGTGLLITGSVLAAVGIGVGAGGGGAFGAQASSKSDELDKINAGQQSATLDYARQLDEDGKQAETLQITMFAVGGAVAVTGVVLLAIGVKKRKQDANARMERMRQDTAPVAFAPAVGRQGAGFTLRGRF